MSELTAHQKRHQYFIKARTHHKKRVDYLRDHYDYKLYINCSLNTHDWEIIRKMVLHSFGCSRTEQLLEEHVERANALAITIIDSMFVANMDAMDDIGRKINYEFRQGNSDEFVKFAEVKNKERKERLNGR